MFGRGFPIQRKGAPIKASTINAGLRAASGLLKLRVGPGLGLKWIGDTPLIELQSPGGRITWARPLAAIGPPTGADAEQMTGGSVRIWRTDPDGMRTDSSINVIAYNGWPGETVPAYAWCRIRLAGVWTIESWSC